MEVTRISGHSELICDPIKAPRVRAGGMSLNSLRASCNLDRSPKRVLKSEIPFRSRVIVHAEFHSENGRFNVSAHVRTCPPV